VNFSILLLHKNNMRSVPVVSALLYRKIDANIEVFLQTRWKPEVSPNYTGLLEIPA
jgi:hypothetical protein